MKTFPVLNYDQYKGAPSSVPWDLVEIGREQAQKNHYQTLERLAERGGLSPCEMIAVIENRPWKSMTAADAVDHLNRAITTFFHGN